jgi:hypothetical protein
MLTILYNEFIFQKALQNLKMCNWISSARWAEKMGVFRNRGKTMIQSNFIPEVLQFMSPDFLVSSYDYDTPKLQTCQSFFVFVFVIILPSSCVLRDGLFLLKQRL